MAYRKVCRHAAAAVVTLVLLGTSAPAVSADTRTQISSAQRRLAALERRIELEKAHIVSMQSSLTALAAAITFSHRQVEDVQSRLAHTRGLLRAAEARFNANRDEIGRVARLAYIDGPAYRLGALLDMRSLSDATAIVSYADDVTARDANLAAEARRLGAQLRRREQQEAALMGKRDAALERVTKEQNALTKRFAEEQVRIGNLARARAEMGSLLVRLRKQLRAEEIAAALAAIAHGTPVSFGKWATAFLATADFPVTRNNLVAMVAWEAAEWTDARWNPLATTYPMPGSSTYNDSGVRNYVTFGQGIQATLLTLREDGFGYEAILASLKRNSDSMTTAKAINASSWCSGCANGNYVVALIPSVQQYYSQYASAGS